MKEATTPSITEPTVSSFVRNESKMGNKWLVVCNSYPLAAYLQETFPEIEYACNTSDYKTEIKYNNVVHPVTRIAADSAFMKLFPVRILKGNANFQILNGKRSGHHRRNSPKSLWRGKSTGQKLIISGEEIPDLRHSQIMEQTFEYAIRSSGSQLPQFPHWNASGWQTYIKLLREGTDSKASSKRYMIM